MTERALNRILCVEDDPDISEIIKLSLEMVGGYEIEMCDSGTKAIAAAEKYAPNLILLDVMMPNMDGPATLRALREIPTTAQTPVIFLTAKVRPVEIAEYRRLGVLGIISKPFDPMTLPAELERIWESNPT